MTLVRVIDVGAPQGHISAADWKTMALHGAVSAAFLRCSEDHNPIDATFAENEIGARAAMMTIGAYHVATFLPGVDAVALAQKHFAQSGRLGANAGDIPPVLDLELPAPEDWAKHGVTGAQLVAGAAAYLAEMTRLCGVAGILYSYPWYLQALGDLSALAAYPLWLASYPKGVVWPADGVAMPVHAPWGPASVWQVSDGGWHVPSGAPVDSDVMLAETLAALMARAAAPIADPLAGVPVPGLDIPGES